MQSIETMLDDVHSKMVCVGTNELSSLRTESHAQPLLTVGDHSNMAPRSSSGADGYPIRKTCDLRIFPIEMILNKYFLEETPGNESKRAIPTDTGKPPFICIALAGSGSGCIVFWSGSRVSSYLLGLLAKIKCSISSSQPDL